MTALAASRSVPASLALGAAAALVLAQGRRIAQARQLASRAPGVFTRTSPGARRRVLLVGDSTGAGVGCDAPDQSIAGLLARDFRDAEVRNLCFNGATVGDVLRTTQQLGLQERYDLVLVFAGGNDVLRRTREGRLARETAQLLSRLRHHAPHVLWAGMANVGLAPLFLPPFSWWMTARTRRVSRLLAQLVPRAGGRFVDFFRERGACPFAAAPPHYYASDRVHPSAEAYAHCYAALRPLLREALG